MNLWMRTLGEMGLVILILGEPESSFCFALCKSFFHKIMIFSAEILIFPPNLLNVIFSLLLLLFMIRLASYIQQRYNYTSSAVIEAWYLLKVCMFPNWTLYFYDNFSINTELRYKKSVFHKWAILFKSLTLALDWLISADIYCLQKYGYTRKCINWLVTFLV